MSPVPANNRDITKEDDQSDISAGDAPQFVIDNSDSDSDTEDQEDAYQGYQLLPQDPEVAESGEDNAPAENPVVVAEPPVNSSVDEAIMQSLDRQDMMNAVAVQVHGPQEDAVPSERAEVWNAVPAASAVSIPMDADHIEKIQSAMSGFTLPPSAQPSWANQLSDDDWKHFLKSQGSVPLSSSRRRQQPQQHSQHSSDKDKTVDR